MKRIKFFAMAIMALAVFASCSDDDDAPVPVNPPELITDVNVIFTPSDPANETVTLTGISDDGIQDPTLTTTGTFVAGETYNATITIFDNVNDENIIEEIVEEADEHFFVYATTATGITVARSTSDEEGPDGELLGLNTTWVFDATATSGSITVQLVHEPSSVDDDGGFGSATGGEFDINNTWAITVQ